MTTVPTASTRAPKTAFYGKTWVHWASLIALSSLGIFSLPFGILFWSGILKDAYNQPRPAAGPPMVIFGVLALLAACGSLYAIIVRRKPLLEIYRDGILTRHGHHPLFVHWKDYQRAQITGTAARWMLTLYGAFFHTRNNKSFGAVQFRQDRFIDTLQSIVATIEHFQRNPAAREQLPVRPSNYFPVLPAN